MIAGDDGPRFIAGGLHAGGVLDASQRHDDELIGGQDQFACQRGMRERVGGAQQPGAPFRFRLDHVVRGEGQDGLPGFRRCHQGDVLAADEVDAKIAGTPQVALRIVAAAFFHAIKELGEVLRFRGEGRPLSEKLHAQGGKFGTGR